MKLADVLLIGLTVLFLIIGLDQTIVLGLDHGYWAFMLALIPFFIHSYRKARRGTPPDAPKGPKPAKKNRRR